MRIRHRAAARLQLRLLAGDHEAMAMKVSAPDGIKVSGEPGQNFVEAADINCLASAGL